MGIGLTASRARATAKVAARAADVFASADMSPRAPRARTSAARRRVPRWAHFFTRRGRSRESFDPRLDTWQSERDGLKKVTRPGARAGSFMTILVRSAQTSH